jgi:hypothetical protein
LCAGIARQFYPDGDPAADENQDPEDETALPLNPPLRRVIRDHQGGQDAAQAQGE